MSAKYLNCLTDSRRSAVFAFIRQVMIDNKKHKVARVKPSHLSMDGANGGVHSIPFTKQLRAQFRQAISQDVMNRVPFYIIELRQDIFPFFLDIDYKLKRDHVWTKKQREYLCHQVLLCLKQFLSTCSNMQNRLTCCLSMIQLAMECPTEKPDEEHDLSNVFDDDSFDEEEPEEPTHSSNSIPRQRGKNANMHIHFPFLRVNSYMAIVMCRALVCFFTERVTHIPILTGTWESIFDESVYNGSGLRILGASKCTKCPSCLGVGCIKCKQIGKINLGRQYRLTDIYRLNEDCSKIQSVLHLRQFKNTKGNVSRELVCCSIQCNPNSPLDSDWSPPSGCPNINLDVLQKHVNKRNQTMTNTTRPKKRFQTLLKVPNHQLHSFNEQKLEVYGHYDVAVNGTIGQLLQQKIRQYHVKYAKTRVRKIKMNRNNTYYRVFVTGINSHFCLNVPAPGLHGNHNIYFVIGQKGVVQKCFCDCRNKARINGATCQSFTGPLKSLSTMDKVKLFPKQKSNPFANVLSTVTNMKLNSSQVSKTQLKQSLQAIQRYAFSKGKALQQLDKNISNKKNC